jgi:hypothetical protein
MSKLLSPDANSDTGAATDVTDETVGKNRRHPKVYVGYYSHAAFLNEDTSRLTNAAPGSEGIANDEYRLVFQFLSFCDALLTI